MHLQKVLVIAANVSETLYMYLYSNNELAFITYSAENMFLNVWKTYAQVSMFNAD